MDQGVTSEGQTSTLSGGGTPATSSAADTPASPAIVASADRAERVRSRPSGGGAEATTHTSRRYARGRGASCRARQAAGSRRSRTRSLLFHLRNQCVFLLGACKHVLRTTVQHDKKGNAHGQLFPAEPISPPLSALKTKRVCSHRPAVCSAAVTLATPSSRAAAIPFSCSLLRVRSEGQNEGL